MLDDPAGSLYPTPLMCQDTDEVYVGRLRRDLSSDHGVVYWVVADNLKRGAATNACNILRALVRRRMRPRPTRICWGIHTVQKFGGTCLDSREKRQLACDRIQEALDKGFRVLAVVSAMGRKGEPYATDTLIALAKGISPEIAPRELDLLLSCGEIISAVLMVQELKTRNIPALALSGGQAGIITDTNFGDAGIIAVNSTHAKRHLDEGKVVVVAGFQGMAQSGDITTLGRGGSDTTAAALGSALLARCVEIYTDVEGIMTADPKMVRSAKTIPFVTYDEVIHLAMEVAKVIHPRAVHIASRAQVPIRVRSLS